MMKLLKIDFMKMVNYKPFLILFITYFVILIALGTGSSFFNIDVEGQKIDLERLGAYNFPSFWQFAAWFALLIKLFLGVLVIFNITNEYSYKTIKQNLIDGLSKQEFYLSKFGGMFIFALLSAFVFAIMVLTLGSIFSVSKELFHEGIEFLGYYFLNVIVFFSILSFLSFLTRKAVFAILLVVIWWIIEAVLNLVEAFIKAIALAKEQQGKDGEVVITEETVEDFFLITDYMPMNCLSRLVQFPSVNLRNFLVGEPVFSINPTDISFVITAIIYFFIFNALSFWLLKKRDL